VTLFIVDKLKLKLNGKIVLGYSKLYSFIHINESIIFDMPTAYILVFCEPGYEAAVVDELTASKNLGFFFMI